MEYKSLSVFQRPRCLVRSSGKRGLVIEENVVSELSKITDRLVVVAIVGLYRTGKSFLWNRLADSHLGFRVGRTIKSETKGIWIWCRRHPTQPNSVLVLLDTEGLGDVDKGDGDYDNKIFTLSLLLCDVLCYNIMNAFDQDSIEKLALICGLVHYRFGSCTTEFVLCVRDFSLEMVKGGKEISDDEYLEYCLESVAGDREETLQTNRTRTFLKRKFPVRKCFTFDRPAGRKKLQELDSLRDKDLSEEFIEDADKFIGYIYDRKPKLLPERVAVDGKIFASMLVQHVDALAAGAVPDIQDALTRVVEKENKELVKNTKSAFSQEMYLLRSKLMSSASFNETCDQTIERLMDDFRTKVRLDSYHKFENLAKNSLEIIKESSRRKNLKTIFKHCYSVVQKLYDQYISDGSQFATIGGHQDYKDQVEQLKEQYGQECRHLDNAEADWAFMALINERSTTERTIIMEDSRLRKERDYHNIDQLRREQENQREEAKRKVETFQQQEEVSRDEEKEAQRQEFLRRDKDIDAYATETRNMIPPGLLPYKFHEIVTNEFDNSEKSEQLLQFLLDERLVF